MIHRICVQVKTPAHIFTGNLSPPPLDAGYFKKLASSIPNATCTVGKTVGHLSVMQDPLWAAHAVASSSAGDSLSLLFFCSLKSDVFLRLYLMIFPIVIDNTWHACFVLPVTPIFLCRLSLDMPGVLPCCFQGVTMNGVQKSKL